MKKKRIKLIFLLLLTALSFLFFNKKENKRSIPRSDSYLIGAYYYLWYPENFAYGTLRWELQPRQEPLLGWYDSRDVKNVEQHIDWCTSCGINFLILDWWPDREAQNKTITDTFLKAGNLDEIKFCIFYETWKIAFHEESGTTQFNRESTEKFISDIEKIADTFFNHPGYLKIGNRPVLMLYLTRTFAGSYKKAIGRLREKMKKKGFDIFLIADEVFWDTRKYYDLRRPGFPGSTEEPQKKRIKLFDAITAYNMYNFNKENHKGYPEKSSFFQDVENLWKKFIRYSGDSVYFVPDIVPGYNDRGVRAGEDHFPLPRSYSEKFQEGSFFSESLDRLGFPFMDKDLQMLIITSWNEWNEDTSIEPVRECPATGKSRGTPDDFFTGGYEYEGYGFKYLEILRNKVLSVTGRVTDKDGNPLKNISVTALKENKIISSSSTNRKGIYNFSRCSMPPGEYEICLQGKKSGKKATVSLKSTLLMTDMKISI